MKDGSELKPSKRFSVVFSVLFGISMLAVLFLWAPYGLLSPTGWFISPDISDQKRARLIDEAIAYGSGLLLFLVFVGAILSPFAWKLWLFFGKKRGFMGGKTKE